MFKRTYKYHVVYYFTDGNGTGIGTCTTTIIEKLNKETNIQKLGKRIAGEYGYENVVIMNFIRLKKG